MFEFVFTYLQTDILSIDETKLDDSFPDSQFKINGYQFPFLRRDRGNRGGGKWVFKMAF